MKRKILIAALSALLCLVAAGTWFIATEAGLRQILKTVSQLMPIDLRVDGVSGRLAGPFSLIGVRVDTETMTVDIGQVNVDWSPASLLAGNLSVERLYIAGLAIVQSVQDSEPVVIPDRLPLPLDVKLDKLELSGFTYRGANSETPFELEQLSLKADLRDERFILENINIVSTEFQLSGRAEFEPFGIYSIDSDLQWEIEILDMPVIKGVSTVSGGTDRLTLRTELSPPYSSEANMVIEDPLDSLSISATLVVSGLEFDEIVPGMMPMEINGQLDADVADSIFSWHTNMQFILSDTEAPEVSFAGVYEGGQITINDIDAVLPGHDARLAGSAIIEPGNGAPSGEVALAWTGIDWPLEGATLFSSPEGTLVVRGSTGSYVINSEFIMDAKDWLNSSVTVNGNGNTESIRLNEIMIDDILGGAVDASLFASWAEGVVADLIVTGRNLDPGVLIEGASGNIEAMVTATMRSAGETGYAMDFDVAANGDLMEQDVNLKGNGELAGQDLSVNTLDLHIGATRISASGKLGSDLQFDWNIDSPDLGNLIPEATGKLSSSGSASGRISAPVITGSVDVSNFSWREHRVAQLSTDIDVDPYGENSSDLLIELAGGYTAGHEISAAVLTLTGTAADHVISIDVSSDLVDLQTRMSGTLKGLDFTEPDWSFQILELGITPQASLGNGRDWNLEEVANGHLAPGFWQLERLCLSSTAIDGATGGRAGNDLADIDKGGTLCIGGRVTPDVADMNLALQSLPVSYVTEYFYPDLNVLGSISGSARVAGPSLSQVTAEVDIEISETDFRATDMSGNDFRILRLEPTIFSVSSNEQGQLATLNLDAPEVGKLKLELGIEQGEQAIRERALSGMIELQVPDISPLIAFLPQFESLNGSISGSAALSGSLSEPVIDGGVELLHGNIVMPDLGLDLSEIYFLAETTDGLLYSIDGEMRSCAGGLTIDGSLNLSDDEAVSILNVNGDNFEFCNSATFQLTVSPDIQIRTQGRNIMITGDLSVPQADIRPAGGTSSDAISASPDQVIIDSSADEEALPLLINSEVNVLLGDQVRFTGFGLITRLTGNLEITDPPRKPTLARGELQLVDGTFEAYGQSLDIEEGRIIYAGGPLYQPGIVLRAVRRPNRNVEVGFNVTGSVTSPQLEMFSFPAMSQAEQLSWLTTGQPLSALSSGESSSLTQTALALSLAGDSAIADRIGNRLGLDQFGFAASGAGFEGDQDGQSSLTIGKYLSPRLFISYAIGVFEPVNIFRAEFSINNNWKLVTETDGVNNRGDIFYEIEKGSVSGNSPVGEENSELK